MFEDRKVLSKAPLNLLVDPEAIKHHKPWQIDLVRLLDSFLALLEKSNPDLILCGSAALSSALIYRLKVETLFLFEKLVGEKKTPNFTEPLAFISMPFRHELYSTNLSDLLYALQKIIEQISSKSKIQVPSHPVFEPEPVFDVDQFLVHIKEILEPFRLRLIDLLKDRREIIFSEFVSDMSMIEEARSFILILFLAMDGIISLEQAGNDIKILGSC